jgi:hypothetical protein
LQITKTCEISLLNNQLLQRCKHADAQDDTKVEDQDARSLILDKLQESSRCRKMQVRQSCDGSE